MATSDGAVARAALDALSETGIAFAVLHREGAIADGALPSDVDLAVEESPPAILARATQALQDADLHPIIVWPYDVGATTVFLTRSDGCDGVQLDLLCDAEGRGKYGVRSAILLESAVAGHRWARLRADHELLYLLRKRCYKGDPTRVAELLAEAKKRPSDVLAAEVHRLFSPRAASSLDRALGGDVTRSLGPRIRISLRSAMRRASRLRHPIGFWVEARGPTVASASVARDLAARFGRYLPYAECSPRPRNEPGAAAWWLRRVAPVRWRPGLLVSWSERNSGMPAPDLCVHVDGRSLDEISRLVVRAMERRLVA